MQVYNLLFHQALFPHEIMHGVFATVPAVFLYKKTHSLKLVSVLYLTSYFIDLDHLIDYIFYYGFSFHLSQMLDGNYFNLSGISYVLFHAWEWIVVLLLCAYKKGGWKTYYAAIALGITAHLVLDSLNVG